MKICFKCNLEPRHLSSSYCRSCKKFYEKQHQQSNRLKYNERTSLRRNAIARKVYDLKEEGCCQDCSRTDKHYLMEYDHTNEKYMGISNF